MTELDVIRISSPDMTKRLAPWSKGSMALRTVLPIVALSQLTRVRSSWVGEVRKLQPIHASRHLNVGEQQRYVMARLKNSDGIVSIYRLDGRESGVFNDI